MAKVVPIDVAQEEINSLMEFKQMSERRKKEKEEAIQDFVDAVAYGDITIHKDQNFKIELKLKFPIGEETKVEKLTFEPRVKVGKLQMHMKGVKADDLHGMIIAYAAALTSQPKALIGELESEDYNLVQKVVIFFM
jgi:hypothetical protein